MARNELTSKRVAEIAGRILERLSSCVGGKKIKGLNDIWTECGIGAGHRVCNVSDLKALAASALTQASDKPKRKRTKNVRRSK